VINSDYYRRLPHRKLCLLKKSLIPFVAFELTRVKRN